MGMLLMMFRKLNLIQRRNNIEFQLTDISQQLLDYQNTSSALSNDSVSITEVYDHYNVVEQRGDIWILEDKENNNAK